MESGKMAPELTDQLADSTLRVYLQGVMELRNALLPVILVVPFGLSLHPSPLP